MFIGIEGRERRKGPGRARVPQTWSFEIPHDYLELRLYSFIRIILLDDS